MAKTSRLPKKPFTFRLRHRSVDELEWIMGHTDFDSMTEIVEEGIRLVYLMSQEGRIQIARTLIKKPEEES